MCCILNQDQKRRPEEGVQDARLGRSDAHDLFSLPVLLNDSWGLDDSHIPNREEMKEDRPDCVSIRGGSNFLTSTEYTALRPPDTDIHRTI